MRIDSMVHLTVVLQRFKMNQNHTARLRLGATLRPVLWELARVSVPPRVNDISSTCNRRVPHWEQKNRVKKYQIDGRLSTFRERLPMRDTLNASLGANSGVIQNHRTLFEWSSI